MPPSYQTLDSTVLAATSAGMNKLLVDSPAESCRNVIVALFMAAIPGSRWLKFNLIVCRPFFIPISEISLATRVLWILPCVILKASG
jgi:hypothetical protein